MANVYIRLDVPSAVVGTANIPELVTIAGTNFPIQAYAFAVGEIAYLNFQAVNYASGNLTITHDWYSRTGQTSGQVRWDNAIAAVTPADAQSMETDAFATSTNTDTTVSGTARALNRTSVTVSNLDSLAQDDYVTLKVTRGTAGGTAMTGDAVLLAVTVSYLSV